MNLIRFKLVTFINFASFFVKPSTSYIEGVEPRLPLMGSPFPSGASLWPLPNKHLISEEVLRLDPDQFTFSVNFELEKCDTILSAFQRYRKYIFFSKNAKLTTPFKLKRIIKLEFEIKSSYCGYPRPEEDESYVLNVLPGISKITSPTIWGALRGIETFSQLIYVYKETYVMNGTFIEDEPAYKYRGIMLDTARHFLPIKIIKQNLDAMSFNKLNVFHWHIVDDQSFPFESKIYPNITLLGAYSINHIYKQIDVIDIIEYARLRGIRVIPEIDTPGHTNAFRKSFPDIITTCYGQNLSNTANFPEHSAKEILDPTNPKTFQILKSIFSEVKSIFKDAYIHLGMDEVYYGCWRSSPLIKEFMRARNWTGIEQIEQYYVEKTLKNVQDIGYNYMVWQDPLENGVKMSDDAVVQVWKERIGDKISVLEIAGKKLKMVVSWCWYLNYISYGGDNDWHKYYLCDPRQYLATRAEKALVIGGEACLWAEYVDATNLISRLWPRASAVGERLWSLRIESDLNPENLGKSVQYRLDDQRCRMLRRGISAAPIINGYCPEENTEAEEEEENHLIDLKLESIFWTQFNYLHYSIIIVFILISIVFVKRKYVQILYSKLFGHFGKRRINH